ncbi:SWIM zinc finger family protein [Streptomyces sp. NPDC096198]|uniref:SWIM zinc finger family protein n=1 Tax=Streptomyces sp. NPDC096198 TaxID=3366080 RepID=UPI0038296F73
MASAEAGSGAGEPADVASVPAPAARPDLQPDLQDAPHSDAQDSPGSDLQDVPLPDGQDAPHPDRQDAPHPDPQDTPRSDPQGAPHPDPRADTPPTGRQAPRPSARPGDAAREALRAARAEAASAENERTGTARSEAQRPEAQWPEVQRGAPAGRGSRGLGKASAPQEPPGEPTPPTPPRDPEAPDGAETSHVVRLSAARRRRAARTRAAGERSREVRDLIAGAFGLPSSADPHGGTEPAARTAADRSAQTQSTRPRREVVDLASKRRDPKPAPSVERPEPPPAARYPRSMAAPDRDGELRRTFTSLPTRTPTPTPTHTPPSTPPSPLDTAAPPPRTPSAEDRFAGTWWGGAWVAALEEGALDAARLARGRTYADQGHVDAVTVTPGLLLAYVQGSRPRPYRVQVRLRTFSDEEWDRFLDAAAEQPGHIAALLDKQVPHSLAECGIRLLPGPGDLDPRCSCPDAGHPCKHAAAVCYQTARLLDQDPFVLLLLRGRGERELIDALSRRNAARAARAAQDQGPAPMPGVRARDAVARGALPPLPVPLPPLAHPEQPPVYPAAPGGPDPLALDQLATDAAARAYALLTTGADPVADLGLWQDAVRLAAARPGSGLTAATRPLYSSLAAATGRSPADLARAVAAWRQGGQEALAVLEEPWDPPAGRFDRARPQLLAADLPAFRPWRNRLTHPDGRLQLRLGRDGLWYAYESEPGQEDWWPRGTPDQDPVGALTGLEASAER